MALTPSNTPLASAVDLLVPVNADEDGDVLGPTSVRYAFIVAVDVLAYGAAIRMKGAAREKLRRIKQQFAAFRESEDNLPLCD